MNETFSMSNQSQVNGSLNITAQACDQIRTLMKKHQGEGRIFFRIRIDSGGCSGFQYQLAMDHRNSDDILFTYDDVQVVTDEVSMELIEGTTIDYVIEMIGSSFQIKNPLSKISCGCGNSFNI